MALTQIGCSVFAPVRLVLRGVALTNSCVCQFMVLGTSVDKFKAWLLGKGVGDQWADSISVAVNNYYFEQMS
jgi:ABC-type Fe3+-siderophore transport system permease subunit